MKTNLFGLMLAVALASSSTCLSVRVPDAAAFVSGEWAFLFPGQEGLAVPHLKLYAPLEPALDWGETPGRTRLVGLGEAESTSHASLAADLAESLSRPDRVEDELEGLADEVVPMRVDDPAAEEETEPARFLSITLTKSGRTASTFTTVPEPALTFSGVLTGLLFLFARRRRFS